MLQTDPRPNVLLIDDQEQNRYILSTILRKNGLQVEECSTGEEGLRRAQQQPSLIILDVKLPDISGFEVCRRIKADPETSSIPLLQISANFVSNESRAMALEGGADGYLTHPIDHVVLMATVRSLLRLKQAELTSRLSARQWQSTFDALSEGIALLDEEDRLVQCNRSFADQCGLASLRPNADARELLLRALGTAAFLDIKSVIRSVHEAHFEGRWYRVTVDPVVSQSTREGSIVVLTDVTERRMAEESIRNSEKLAATGRLAHVIAHEINNPLEALVNLVYLARSEQPDGRLGQYLQMAEEELNRVSRITKQVLAFHRDTSSAIDVDMTQLMDSVLTLYSSQLSNKSLELDYRRQPAPAIQGFPGELRQVFANILGNAIDATPAKGTLLVKVRPGIEAGITGVRVTIADNGEGIPAAIRKRIFEPFFTTKELKGSGMGLWLTQSIIAKHNGRLRLRSRTQPASGTCISVFLPAAGKMSLSEAV